MANFSEFNPTKVLSQQRSSDSAPFVVAAMFTNNLSGYAERLRLSLAKFELDFVLYEVPTVHCSISNKGTSDIAFSKPNFINYVLSQFRVPVLYVDIDVVFRDTPNDVFEFGKSGVDFACYNWLNDRASDAYLPAPATINGLSFKKRFYRFSFSIDMFDPSQLVVSGASQFYSPNAIPLLRRWLDEIACRPEVADDELLDIAYNTWNAKNSIRAHWWDKGYCRYPWWINTRPIIDHPDLPASHNPARTFKAVAGRERFSSNGIPVLPSQSRFPRDCIIDTKEKLLLRLNSRGEIEVVGLFSDELWVDQIEEPELRIVGNMVPLIPLPRVQSSEQKQKSPRNAPCPCGSGKKYKHCHGARI